MNLNPPAANLPDEPARGPRTRAGLYYYGYRYLDTQLGRWLSRDPIGERGGLNLYAFLENDGVNFMDARGLSKLIISGKIRPVGIGKMGAQPTRRHTPLPEGATDASYTWTIDWKCNETGGVVWYTESFKYELASMHIEDSPGIGVGISAGEFGFGVTFSVHESITLENQGSETLIDCPEGEVGSRERIYGTIRYRSWWRPNFSLVFNLRITGLAVEGADRWNTTKQVEGVVSCCCDKNKISKSNEK